MKVFVRIDHAVGAKKAGREIRHGITGCSEEIKKICKTLKSFSGNAVKP